MNITYETLNHVKLSDYAQLILENELHNNGSMSSFYKLCNNALGNYEDLGLNRLYGLSTTPEVHEDVSVVFAYDQQQIVGVIIFFHDCKHGTVRYNGKDAGYTFFGWLGMFVKKEYRNNGIAREMLKCIQKVIEKEFNSLHNAFRYFACFQKARTICGKVFDDSCIVDHRKIEHKWESNTYRLLNINISGSKLYKV